MGTFNDGDSGSSIRTKINTAIQKTEGTSAISTIDVDGGAIDGVTLGTNSAVTEAQVDNININGNTISSTDTNGDVTIDPNGTGDVNIGNFKFDADQTVGAGQDNYVLTYDNSGGKISLEAASGGGGGISNVVEDTTPQLGGDLDTNDKSIKFGDRSSSGVNELVFGAGDDLKISHNGINNHSQIVEGGSGNLQIYASNLQLRSNAGADYIIATDGGAVELYHNANKKAETTSSGLQTTGTLNVNGAYTLPTSDGSANQVLQTDGSGSLSFATAGGAHTLISTTNVTSGVAQIDISLSGTYEKYLLTYINVVASGDTNEVLRLRVSDDGGSSFETGSTYSYRGVSWYSLADDTRGSGDPSNFGTGADSIHIKEASAQRDGVQHGEIHIYDPHNSSNDFTCYCTFVGQGDTTGGGVAGGVTTGSFNVAADYNAIRLYFNGDNMTSGEFKLFGVS